LGLLALHNGIHREAFQASLRESLEIGFGNVWRLPLSVRDGRGEVPNPSLLDIRDPDYQVLIAFVARKSPWCLSPFDLSFPYSH
jgi:hypothetical protein